MSHPLCIGGFCAGLSSQAGLIHSQQGIVVTFSGDIPNFYNQILARQSHPIVLVKKAM
jgi:hypothetical protein